MAFQYPIVPQVTDPVEDHTIVCVATGKCGRAPGELMNPAELAIDEATNQIFVANYGNDRVEVFSETGEYLYQLGVRVGQLLSPISIAMHGDSIYVCSYNSTVSQFSLTNMSLVRRIGGRRSKNGQFKGLGHLTTDLIGRVFIPDSGNNRICIHDPNLNHLRNITHKSLSCPICVKLSRDRLYVLCVLKNLCIVVLTLEGEKLHSLITCGEGMDVSYSFSFCLDHLHNFLISYYWTNSIRVFSPEGNLLHTIGRKGHQPGMFSYPTGVAITPNGRLVCVTENKKYGLQIFY